MTPMLGVQIYSFVGSGCLHRITLLEILKKLRKEKKKKIPHQAAWVVARHKHVKSFKLNEKGAISTGLPEDYLWHGLGPQKAISGMAANGLLVATLRSLKWLLKCLSEQNWKNRA